MNGAREIPAPVLQLLQHNHLANVSELAKKIGRDHTKAHVYRILVGETRHKPILTLVKLARAFSLYDDQGRVDLDKMAWHLLDVSDAHSRRWIQEQMIKNQIPSVRNLAIRAGIPLSTAQQFVAGELQYIQLRIYRDIARGIGINLYNLLDALLADNPEHGLLNSRPEIATLANVRYRRGINSNYILLIYAA